MLPSLALSLRPGGAVDERNLVPPGWGSRDFGERPRSLAEVPVLSQSLRPRGGSDVRMAVAVTGQEDACDPLPGRGFAPGSGGAASGLKPSHAHSLGPALLRNSMVRPSCFNDFSFVFHLPFLSWLMETHVLF